jgi:hypothetical protein
MQVLRDVIIVAHVRLAAILELPEDDSREYDTDPEDLESPREFPARDGRCPLVDRLKTLAAKLVPPPPPRWTTVLFVSWIAWCWATRSVVLWVLGQDIMLAASDELLALTA